MRRAARLLVLPREGVLMPPAVPGNTVHPCRMQAGAAVALHRLALVADRVMVAESALPPSPIFADAGQQPGGADHALGLGQDAKPRLGIVADALLVELVRILADCEIEGPIEAAQRHVGLHLRIGSQPT